MAFLLTDLIVEGLLDGLLVKNGELIFSCLVEGEELVLGDIIVGDEERDLKDFKIGIFSFESSIFLLIVGDFITEDDILLLFVVGDGFWILDVDLTTTEGGITVELLILGLILDWFGELL